MNVGSPCLAIVPAFHIAILRYQTGCYIQLFRIGTDSSQRQTGVKWQAWTVQETGVSLTNRHTHSNVRPFSRLCACQSCEIFVADVTCLEGGPTLASPPAKFTTAKINDRGTMCDWGIHQRALVQKTWNPVVTNKRMKWSLARGSATSRDRHRCLRSHHVERISRFQSGAGIIFRSSHERHCC